MPDIFVSKAKNKEEIEDKTTVSSVPKTEVEKKKFRGHSHNPLASFCAYPHGIGFETREKEEKVILLLRQHPIVNFKWVVMAIVLIVAPPILNSFGILATIPGGLHLVVMLAWYLITMIYMIENFLNWFFNVYIITNIRVVDIDFYNLIYKQVSDANLDKIQDVTYNMGGVVRTVFNYGNVLIQTAAEINEFEFEGVPQPNRVAKVLEDLIVERKGKQK